MAKLWVPLVVPWAMDRTIDYANVPWVFRVAPDDGRQAEALLGWLGAASRGARLLVEEEREARTGAARLAEAADRLGLVAPRVEPFDPLTPAPAVLDRLPADPPPAALLVWARPAIGLALLAEARRRFPDLPLLAPAPLAGPAALGIEGLIVASPVDLASPSPAAEAFAAAYRSRFREEPPPLAVLTYDSVALTLAAITRAGPNRARIRDELAATVHEGAAGTIRFDGLGGNPAPPVLCQVRAGRWVGVRAVETAAGAGR